ncbi:hypothetical protein D3C71_2070670 [compost metagenome]
MSIGSVRTPGPDRKSETGTWLKLVTKPRMKAARMPLRMFGITTRKKAPAREEPSSTAASSISERRLLRLAETTRTA